MCDDPKMNVRLKNEQSKMSLNFNSKGQIINQLYFATWLRITSKFKNLPDTSIMKVTPVNDTSKVYMELKLQHN